MDIDDAAALIAPAVLPAAPNAESTVRWADFGAGRGTFTRALARLIGPAGQVAGRSGRGSTAATQLPHLASCARTCLTPA